MIYASAIDQLTADDKKLPAVEGILPLLKKGVYVGIYICTYICVYVCSSENAPDVCIGQEG